MAVIHDLAPALLKATRRQIALRGGDLSDDDLAGAAVLLGVAAEVMLLRPIAGGDDLDAETHHARQCLAAAMRAVQSGRELR